MALVFADRVKDSSTTTGTGTFTISGTAATGYQTFNSGIGVGNTCYYCIAGQAGSTDPTEWEVGLGTLASATTITRSSGNVLSSSSGAGTLVNFSAGAKDVFVTSPALWATSPSFTGNVSTAQLSVGTTTTTSAYIHEVATTALQYQFLMQGTNTFAGNATGMYLNPSINGTAASTTLVGLNVQPNFNPLATVASAYAVTATAYLNNAFPPTNMMAYRSVIQLTSTALTGTISYAISFFATAPVIDASATTAITNAYQFYAASIAKGTLNTVTNAYAFYGNQATGSATNSWNLYMAGNAPNYLAGQLQVDGQLLASGQVQVGGQLLVGGTSLTNGVIACNSSQSTAPAQLWFGGVNTTNADTIYGIRFQAHNLQGTVNTTTFRGLDLSGVIYNAATSASIGNIYGITYSTGMSTSSTVVPATMYGIWGQMTIPNAAVGGTTSNIYNMYALGISIGSTGTTSVTNVYQFRADAITQGAASTISNAYAFHGNQTIAGATNTWNLYMAGTAPNYLAGQLAIGTTTLTNGFLTVTATQSNSAYSIYVSGTNSNASTTIGGLYNSGSFTGASATTVYGINNQPSMVGAAMTTAYGIENAPSVTGAVLTTAYGIDNTLTYNANAATTLYGIRTQVRIGILALGGSTIANLYGMQIQTPNIGSFATTNITNLFQYYADNITKGSSQTVTNAYSFYANQGTGSATNSWCFYAAGAAPNYLAGALNVGSTTLTNAPVYFALSTSLQYNFMMQGTNTYSTASGTPIGMYINPNINGIASSVSMVGLSVVPIFGPVTSAVVSSLYGIIGNSYLNTANAPVTVTLAGIRGLFTLASAVSTSAVANGYAFLADTPSISSTSTITTAVGFFATNITKGSGTITNAYAFYGNQATGSATNSWNLYMNGAAPNYLNSNLLIGTTTVPSTSGNLVQSGLHATSAAAPTVASGTTIAVTTQIAFISGTTAIATITAPNPISAGGGQITLIPTGAFTTTTAGNIALASTAVVSKALIMTYDTTTAKWYPSY